MLDRRVPPLPAGLGERLDDDAYVADFRARRQAIRGGESWKLERLQHFEEDDSPTWDALRRGDWTEALRLVEEEREAAEEAAERDRRNGSPFRRVRIVEEPLTPYMQWELHVLKMRAEAGHQTVVLPAEALSAAEVHGRLPEIVMLDGKVLYRLRYTESGVFEDAVRFTDPETVKSWVDYVKCAAETAEDIRMYFDRAVAPLPPPSAL